MFVVVGKKEEYSRSEACAFYPTRSNMWSVIRGRGKRDLEDEIRTGIHVLRVARQRAHMHGGLFRGCLLLFLNLYDEYIPSN